MWVKKVTSCNPNRMLHWALSKILGSISQNLNLTYSIEKSCFLHSRTYYNGPQKVWQTIWKLETQVVIDKTRVGCAIVQLCLSHGHDASPSSCSYQNERIKPIKSTVARFSIFTWRMLVIEITFFSSNKPFIERNLPKCQPHLWHWKKIISTLSQI